MMMKQVRFIGVALCAGVLACDNPTSNTSVVPGVSEGQQRITFVSASPAPGSTVTGCGADIQGCTGRVKMTFELTSQSPAGILRVAVYLFARDRNCLSGTAVQPTRGSPTTGRWQWDVLLDTSNGCPTPVNIVNSAVVVDGATDASGRQEFGLSYAFTQ